MHLSLRDNAAPILTPVEAGGERVEFARCQVERGAQGQANKLIRLAPAVLNELGIVPLDAWGLHYRTAAGEQESAAGAQPRRVFRPARMSLVVARLEVMVKLALLLEGNLR